MLNNGMPMSHCSIQIKSQTCLQNCCDKVVSPSSGNEISPLLKVAGFNVLRITTVLKINLYLYMFCSLFLFCTLLCGVIQ